MNGIVSRRSPHRDAIANSNGHRHTEGHRRASPPRRANDSARFMAERLGLSIAKVMQERGIPMDGPPPPFTITEPFNLFAGGRSGGAAPCSVK